MSDKTITPDLGFVKDVMASGGDSLKKCFQCATCTVVCNVTPDEKPFPRKEMLQAQWGLKDELYSNPDIWLCHQCSDCTAYCPRGAKPGEVLGAIRKMSLSHFATPGFLADLAGKPSGLLVLLALPVLILLAIISVLGNFPSALPLGEKIVFSEFIPTTKAIDPLFVAVSIFAVVMFAKGIKRYWAGMSAAAPPTGSVGRALVPTVIEILKHSKFSTCDLTPKRTTAHQLLLYSFIILGVTTTLAAMREYIHVLESPLYVPMKLLGNVGAAALLLGLAIVIINRFVKSSELGLGSYFDWLLILVIATVAVTGTLAEVLRLNAVAPAAYWVYFIHLVSVFFLFAYAPYSKMAHMVYRTAAMVFAGMTGRN